MDTQERLLDVAEFQIRQKGYNAVSFRELADELGIKSASVHYHFPTKQQLGVAVVHRYRDRFLENLNILAAKSSPQDGRVRTLCTAYRMALEKSNAHCLCGMLGAETRGLPEAVSQQVARFFQANIDWLATGFPTDWSPAKRQMRAAQVVAALQGGILLSISLDDSAHLVAAIQLVEMQSGIEFLETSR